MSRPKPLPIGTDYDGAKIVEVVDEDPDDDYQPFLYMLEGGETVWIPQTKGNRNCSDED